MTTPSVVSTLRSLWVARDVSAERKHSASTEAGMRGILTGEVPFELGHPGRPVHRPA